MAGFKVDNQQEPKSAVRDLIAIADEGAARQSVLTDARDAFGAFKAQRAPE